MPKNRKTKTRTKTERPVARPKVTRRNVFQNAALYGLGALAVIGIGIWILSGFRGALDEQDLSVIGTGQPAIVQVHDRNCDICTQLQIEARAALATLAEDDIAYRVAYLDTEPGMAFATAHGASFATLLFFDGAGNMTRKMQGANDRNTLRAAFLSHASDG